MNNNTINTIATELTSIDISNVTINTELSTVLKEALTIRAELMNDSEASQLKPKQFNNLVVTRLGFSFNNKTDNSNEKKANTKIKTALLVAEKLLFKKLIGSVSDLDYVVTLPINKLSEMLSNMTNNELSETISSQSDLKEINSILKTKKTRIKTVKVYEKKSK